jgi:hypothetical protein
MIATRRTGVAFDELFCAGRVHAATVWPRRRGRVVAKPDSTSY